MENRLERIDRNLIYGFKPLFESIDKFCEKKNYPKLTPEAFLEGILFLSYILQNKNMNLLGLYEFSMDEFASFTGKSKKSISKTVKGFRVEQGDGQLSNIEVLDNQLEHILWIFFTWDLPVNQVYNQKYFRWYRPGINTIISEIITPIIKEEKGKKINYGKKKYMIGISNSYTELLLKQFIQIDLKKLNKIKTPRNSYTLLYFYLLQMYNNSVNQKKEFITSNINYICDLCGLDFSNYNANNKYQKPRKVISILNKFKENDILPIRNISKINSDPSSLLIQFNIQGRNYIGNKSEDDIVFQKKIIMGLFKEVYNEVYLKKEEQDNLSFKDWYSLGINWKECCDKIKEFYLKSDERFIRILNDNPGIYVSHFPETLDRNEIAAYFRYTSSSVSDTSTSHKR